MRKTLRKLAAISAAAIMAVCSLTASSSALSLCIGGKCINISLPSDCRTALWCIGNGSCGTQKTADCGTAGCGSTGKTTQKESGASSAVPTGGSATEVSEVSEVFALVNSAREENGLSALSLSSELCAAAEIRAKEIVRSFSHTRPDGRSCFTVLKDSGISYRAAGENIAYGQRTASAVMTAWMNSSGHRANILGRNFGRIGIACYTVNGVRYWVQLFAN